MRLSLSSKLSFLLPASLACVLIPALITTYVYVRKHDVDDDERAFAATLLIIDEAVEAGFIHLNASKARIVVRSKGILRTAAGLFSSFEAGIRSEESSAARDALRRLQSARQAEYASQGILVASFSPAALRQSPQSGLELVPEIKDIKGRTLADILGRLPVSGDFAICRLPSHGLMLLYFAPGDDAVIVSAVSMRRLEEEAENTARTLIRTVVERFSGLELYPGGFAALIDARGEFLAGRGAFGEADMAALAPLFAEARAKGKAVAAHDLRGGQSEPEEYLAAAGFSKPFNWFTVLAAPMREVEAPSRSLMTRLILQSLGIGPVMILAIWLLFGRALRPLRQVLQKISQLPDIDFSAPDAGKTLALDLPLNRQDEVGDLARAFASMGDQLNRNIRAFMEAAGARDRMQGELNAARDIQLGILPPPESAPNVPGLSSYALLEPARETGGDLYDFFTVPDGRYAFVIGDVSGKGVPAALFMAVTVTLARFTLSAGDDPGAALGKINDLLQARNPGSLFVTLFIALYDPQNGRLEYADAGHNPPCLVGRDASVISLEGLSGPMAGIMPGLAYPSFTRDLREGELCLLYTDGVIEAVNAAMELYGEDRLLRYLRENGARTPQALLAGIFADIKKFRGEAPPFDDIAMLAFARR
ncbi:MAG: SpoIIE family protein phosphatase [Desulfovibrio sp.]|jgi:sigma-B regulation protein RsbU (phosphoserine phosphatase)|nr:SpoIIE family protein phosphatase [Desulfovibrio sp.]